MRGFTLIEFLIYIGIVTIVLIVFFNFAWEIIYGNIKSQSIREVQQNARFAMEKIIRTIEESSAINSPVPGSSDNSLSLEMADPNLDPTIFDLSEEKIRITQGVNGPYELTSTRVMAKNLQFTNLSYTGTPGTVRIEMNIEHIKPSARSEYIASLGLKSTASLVSGAGITLPYIAQIHYRWRNDDGGE